MESRLQSAVSEQRFGEAARLRDEIQALRLTDDYYRVEKQIQAAVTEQNFREAAALRDVLYELTPPPYKTTVQLRPEVSGPLAAAPPDGAHATWSLTETAGIVVRTDSWHMPELDGRAEVGEGHLRYTFKYKVNITNNTTDAVQLVGRHWIIRNATGPESEVQGAGVVGRQPVLMPGESFEYTSACPLVCELAKGSRVVGNMKGEFTFVTGATGTAQLTAEVGKFYFVLPKDA